MMERTRVNVAVGVKVWVTVMVRVGVCVMVGLMVLVRHLFEPPTPESHDASIFRLQPMAQVPGVAGAPQEFDPLHSQHWIGVGGIGVLVAVDVTVPVLVTVAVGVVVSVAVGAGTVGVEVGVSVGVRDGPGVKVPVGCAGGEPSGGT